MLTSSEWSAIRLIAVIIAALSLVAGSALAFWDAFSRPDEQNRIRRWLHLHWATIRVSSILTLPKRLIRAFLDARGVSNAVAAWVVVSDRGSTVVGSIAGLSAVGVILITFPFAYLGLIFWASISLLSSWSKLQNWRFIAVLRAIDDLGGFLVALSAFAAFLSLGMSRAPSFASVALVGFAVPIGPVVADFVSDWKKSLASKPIAVDQPLWIHSLGIGLSMSAVTTACAMALGHVADPSLSLQLSFQLLASNVIFDTLTLALVFVLLDLAVSDPPRLGLGLAGLTSVCVSALLACASLWIGLLGSPSRLRFLEVVRILVARSTDGSRFKIGGFFFLMHTTFAPIVAFFFLVFLSWTAKILLRLLLWLMNRGSDSDVNPIRMSAALCGVVFALFTGLAAITGELRDRAKADEAPNHALHPAAAAKRGVSNRDERERPPRVIA